MRARFEDILARVEEEPSWYDENGTPRYGKFSPSLSPDIYASEVLLIEIACQSCIRRFFVEMSWNTMRAVFEQYNDQSFSDRIKDWLKNRKKSFCPVHYGDPPRHNCGGGGETMNCYDLRIIEFHKKVDFKFERVKKYEIELEQIERR